MFEEWDKVQHFEEWDQVQHLEGGDAIAQVTKQEPVVVMAGEVHTVGVTEPGSGHNLVELPLSSSSRPTCVRTAKNRYIPSHTGKRYGYAMAQIMGSMHGELALSWYNTWQRNLGVSGNTDDQTLWGW